MNEIDKWREWFLGQNGDVRNAFLVFNESNIHLTSVFLSANFKPGFDSYNGGIHIDLGFSNETGEITAVGATFSKCEAALYVSSSLIVFHHEKTENTGKLFFSVDHKCPSESANGLFEYELIGNTFRLIDLNVSLLFWNQTKKDYIPVKQWDMSDYQSREFEILCCKCFGEGVTMQISIPKADYKLGLNGYALYSCNRINGTYGCKECGGSGAQYQQWYLEENPSLRSESENFRKGWGSIPQENVSEAHILSI